MKSKLVMLSVAALVATATAPAFAHGGYGGGYHGGGGYDGDAVAGALSLGALFGSSVASCSGGCKKVMAAQDDAAAYLAGGERSAALDEAINIVRSTDKEKTQGYSDEQIAFAIVTAN